MSYQNVSATLAAANFTAVLNAIDTINTNLPFLVALTEEERRSLFANSGKWE